jgi:hypothetical protein
MHRAASNTSLLPIGMQTSVATTGTKESRCTMVLGGMSFSLHQQFRLFFSGSNEAYRNDNVERKPVMVFQI